MQTAIDRLYGRLEERGLRGRVASVRRLGDLEHDIRGRYAEGLFDEAFFRERLGWFEFSPPAALPGAASLIVVAVPRPQTRVGFSVRGQTRWLILPPTYAGYEAVARRAEELLSGWLSPDGYRVVKARLPQKALAVRSGLADYGRNNICYAPGLGSFFQPVTFFSDLPCPEDTWREPRMMDRCRDCRACLVKCPTGAITAERFLLHAERCLVFHNERPPEYPFPAWIDPSAHNCPVGCMICQRFCPEDKSFMDWIEGDDEFSDEETSLLLAGAPRDQLPAATVARLERLELIDYLNVLPRNLGVLLAADGPAG